MINLSTTIAIKATQIPAVIPLPGSTLDKAIKVSCPKSLVPTKAVITEAIKDFKKVAADKGLELSDELAEEMVGEVWRGATLTPGFKLGVKEPAQVRFRSLPDFMQQSLADKITDKTLR